MKETSSTDLVAVETYLAQQLVSTLEQEPVVLLLSGGSAIPSEVAIVAAVPAHLQTRLSVGLVDERFGPVGHADSNWQQLCAQGLNLGQATPLPVLRGLDLVTTATAYAATLTQSKGKRIGIFGIGVDGHTAGILPHSVASEEEKHDVLGYQAADFSRITITPHFIRTLDQAVLYARGQTKEVIMAQYEEDLPISVMPAQVLKTVPQIVVIKDE